MQLRKCRFRDSVAFAGCMLAGTLAAGCSKGALPSAPSTVLQGTAGSGSSERDRISGAPASAEQNDLAAAREATAGFHDVDAALAADYRLERICVETPLGAMGIHALNPERLASQAIEAERPAGLLYMPQPEGGVRLVGVEYVRFVLVRNTETGQVGPWISSSKWPSTYEVVNDRPELFGQPFAGPMAGHSPTMPWHWDLHVWLWANNPRGMFEMWNPSLSCGS